MKKYFIALDEMSLEEIDIWRLLCRYSSYDTDIAGYTVNQLVINSDKSDICIIPSILDYSNRSSDDIYH